VSFIHVHIFSEAPTIIRQISAATSKVAAALAEGPIYRAAPVGSENATKTEIKQRGFTLVLHWWVLVTVNIYS
jgi:hypothetical protein